ncbi:MAG: type II toxin-antitoxin system VapC family toxin [Planctomycetaceae bacterium]|nr:type II toxin-antitoxin system VapC family toxin [Planctomycetaceae bacterium]
MIYFDTAYMLKCYVSEPGSQEVRDTWKNEPATACCEFGKMEFVAALHRVHREGRVTSEELHILLRRWHKDQELGLWNWLPLHAMIIEEVLRMFETLPREVYLRAGDAIHLACARENGFTAIYTNDRHLKSAANHWGLTAGDVLV